MTANELAALLSRRPMLTRADVAIFLRVSVRHLDRLRAADARFPRPSFVRGPRWSPDEIARYVQVTTKASPARR